MWEVVGERLQSPDKAWRSNDVRSERGMNAWQCTAAGRVLALLSMAVYCCWEGAGALKQRALPRTWWLPCSVSGSCIQSGQRSREALQQLWQAGVCVPRRTGTAREANAA